MKEQKKLNNKNILISIIVPIYNAEKYLKECIDSILQQTFCDFELILVDDGSVDESIKICEYFRNKDDRIKVIHKSNGGVSEAREAGLACSIGRYISFVDNDDIILKNMYKTLIQTALLYEEADIIAANRIDLETSMISSYIYEYDKKVKKNIDSVKLISGKDACTSCFDKECQIITPLWGKLYKREFFISSDYIKYKEKCPNLYMEDVLLTPILLYNANKIAVIDEKLYIHREVPTSISRCGKLSPYYLDIIESDRILLEFYREKALKDNYKNQLKNYSRTLLRSYYLLHSYTQDYSLKKNSYNKINTYFQYYKHDFLILAKTGILEKISIIIFSFSKKLWSVTAGNLYFGLLRKVRSK